MTEKNIYNCHAHIFTNKNLPNRFLFRCPIVPALRFKPFFWLLNYPVRWFLNLLLWISPFDDHGFFNRYAAFIKAAHRTERENLQRLIDYYPEDSKFIILPMDFKYMEAGNVKENIDQQHKVLCELAESRSDIIIPFAHIDPRRHNARQMLEDLVENHNFKGVKIYPTLGYPPDQPRLMAEIYPYMVEKNIPLMAHCSKGSVNIRGMGREKAWEYAHPNRYISIMQKFPDLRICLAHFGGSREWKYHLKTPRDQKPLSWLRCIRHLIKIEKYSNLYVDISHTMMNFSANHALLSVLLEDSEILDKVLFGSDFYAGEKMKYTEKLISIDLRHALGDKKFWRIAYHNPLVYLGLNEERNLEIHGEFMQSEALEKAKELIAEVST